MLETIREYARERLAESGEEQAVRQRHAGYYAWYTNAIDPMSHPRGLAVIEDDLDNLRAALGWSVESGEVLPGLLICHDFVFWGDHANEGLHWLEALLARPHAPSRVALGARYCAAALALFNYDYAIARARIEAYYQLAGELGDPTYPKSWNLGFIALGEGDVAGAGVLFEQFLADEHAILNRERFVAWGHFGLGAYHLMAGDPTVAHSQFEASLAYFRSIDQTGIVIDFLHKLGFTAQIQGNLPGAIAYFRESIDLARLRRYRRAIAINLFGFASVALERDQLEHAARLFGAGEALSEMTSGMDPEEHYMAGRNVAALRDQLDPATLEARWAEGRALDWEQAVDEALAFADEVEIP
jgi:tetratricopeptide (TPR) repeat protein